MQTLTYNQVRAAARKAYEACRLTAQHPVAAHRQCVYDTGDGYHCAVGAAFDAETLAAIRDKGIDHDLQASLLNGVVVDFPSHDIVQIAELQRAHDDWAMCARSYGVLHQRTRSSERKFARMIGIKD